MVRECNISGCDREVRTFGMCATHYKQTWIGRTPTPIRGYRMTYRDQNGRVCTKCDRYKTWSEFYNSHTRCKECHKAQVNERRRAGL